MYVRLESPLLLNLDPGALEYFSVICTEQQTVFRGSSGDTEFPKTLGSGSRPMAIWEFFKSGGPWGLRIGITRGLWGGSSKVP